MKKDLIEIKWKNRDLGLVWTEIIDRNGFEYYPPDMDKDMIPICDALNSINGVRTFFCCSGHGRKNYGDFYILFGICSLLSLKAVSAAFGAEPKYKKEIMSDFKPYTLEIDARFWALKNKELCVRISNPWVDGLDDCMRKREFNRIIRLLQKIK